MPNASITALTDPPAIRPVPFDAEHKITVVAPCFPVTLYGIVLPRKETLIRSLRALTVAFAIAEETSLLLPKAIPTLPS